MGMVPSLARQAVSISRPGGTVPPITRGERVPPVTSWGRPATSWPDSQHSGASPEASGRSDAPFPRRADCPRWPAVTPTSVASSSVASSSVASSPRHAPVLSGVVCHLLPRHSRRKCPVDLTDPQGFDLRKPPELHVGGSIPEDVLGQVIEGEGSPVGHREGSPGWGSRPLPRGPVGRTFHVKHGDQKIGRFEGIPTRRGNRSGVSPVFRSTWYPNRASNRSLGPIDRPNSARPRLGQRASDW